MFWKGYGYLHPKPDLSRIDNSLRIPEDLFP